MFFGGIRLTNSRLFKRIALQTVQNRSEGYTSNFKQESMIGKTGTAYTVLRPSGKVMIEGSLFDASTRGDYIEKNDKIKVINDEGTSLKVKKLDE
jgi:membrane-bound serine protease (ClpP class)